MRNIAFVFLAVCLCFSTCYLSGCGLTPEQIRERARAVKEKLDEAKENNKSLRVVCAKKHIEKGSVISADDVEMKEMPDSALPQDVLTLKTAAELKKAAKDINYGEVISQKDLAPLVDQR